jgi:hypothetical protein
VVQPLRSGKRAGHKQASTRAPFAWRIVGTERPSARSADLCAVLAPCRTASAVETQVSLRLAGDAGVTAADVEEL